MKICAKWTLLKFCLWCPGVKEARRPSELHFIFRQAFPFRPLPAVSSLSARAIRVLPIILTLLSLCSARCQCHFCPARLPAPVASVAHTQYGACNAETHFACRSNDNANIVVDFHVTEGKQELATVSELEIVSWMRLLSHLQGVQLLPSLKCLKLMTSNLTIPS